MRSLTAEDAGNAKGDAGKLYRGGREEGIMKFNPIPSHTPPVAIQDLTLSSRYSPGVDLIVVPLASFAALAVRLFFSSAGGTRRAEQCLRPWA